MDSRPPARGSRKFWEEAILQAITLGGLVLSIKFCMKYLDPYRDQRNEARKRMETLKKHLGLDLKLDEFEQLLAVNVINPRNIDVDIGDISGLDDLINELESKVVLPMMRPELYRTTLWKPARGVLLYGPPGTGKTMLAKSLAKHSGCFFLNVTTSSIMSKWLGDANRLVRAIFSLARKMEPCIIFIDEVDALLGKRGMHQEHESSLQVKTEFMQLWDGMESMKGQRVVVMGATNRPWCVDEAVLRRFSVQHEVGLPDKLQRLAILRGYLQRHNNELGEGAVSQELLAHNASSSSPDGTTHTLALETIAEKTEGYSGSDLMEMCAQAAQRMFAEQWAKFNQQRAATASAPQASTWERTATLDEAKLELRSVTLEDFLVVLERTKPSKSKASEYNRRTRGEASIPPELAGANLLKLLELMVGPRDQGQSGSS